MRDFELYGTVAAIFCVCDTINYLLTQEDLSRVFNLAGNYLDPGGLFIFDMDTGYLYEEVLETALMLCIMSREALYGRMRFILMK